MMICNTKSYGYNESKSNHSVIQKLNLAKIVQNELYLKKFS